jgi:ectoine hydroxylase-related dioxygenase (phytanoyl-CoA dioxygenase family)
MTALIDAQAIADFQTNGATVLRGVFADWVDVLREAVDFNVANPGPDGRFYTGENGGGRFMTDYCNWTRIPGYRDFIFNSNAAEIGAALMDAGRVQLFHEHVLVKEAATDVTTPWHQDAPYYSVQAEKTLSLWIPLDEIPRERTLEFIGGSHLTGAEYQPQRFNGQALNEGDGLLVLPDYDSHRAAHNIMGWAVSPGDAVAFDFRVVHGAPANDSPSTQRRAFSLRLVGEDATFVRHQDKVTSPPFPGVSLQHGDALSGPEFPVLLGAP